MSGPTPNSRRSAGQPDFDAARDVMASLAKIIGSPDMCSRRWVWEQYDHTVMNDTVQRPGGDCGVVRVHGSNKGLAITTDVTPRYCFADPFEGGKQAVAEAWRNITAVGGTPLAVTDNLNFGNPEKPEEHVADRGRHQRHRRGLPRARFPDRLRQLLALQRDQWRRHPADAGHRCGGSLEGCRSHGDRRASSAKAMC